MSNTPTRRLTVVFATVLALAAAAPAMAHRGGMDGGPGGMGRHQPPSAEQVAQSLATAKAALKITPAQDKAWQAWETLVKRQSAEHLARRQQMQEQMRAGTTPPTPEARDKQREAMRQQFESDRAAREQARSALYATLTPEQQRQAGRLLWGPQDHGGHGGPAGSGEHPGRDGDRHGEAHGRHRHGGDDRPAPPAPGGASAPARAS